MICLLIYQLSLCSKLRIISRPHVYHVYFNFYMAQLTEILEIIFLPRVRLEICKKFIIIAGVQTWLRLPSNMKCDSNFRAFKRSRYTFLSDKYVNMYLITKRRGS